MAQSIFIQKGTPSELFTSLLTRKIISKNVFKLHQLIALPFSPFSLWV